MIDSIKKLYRLLCFCGAQNSLCILFFLTIFASLFEVVSIAFIFPFIALLTTPSIIQKYPILSRLYDYFHFHNANHFTLAVGIVLLALISIGNLVSAYALWYLYRFSFQAEHRLSSALLKKYLAKPYLFFLSTNSAILSKTILNEVRIVIKDGIILMLRITGKLTTIAVIILFLFFYNPLLTVMMTLTVLSLYCFFIFGFRRYTARKSQENSNANALKYKHVSEALGAIQDIILMNLSIFILKKYDKSSITFSATNASANILAETPRYLLDIVLFGGVLFYIIIMLFRNDSTLFHIVPTLAMFVYAAVRIMPSISFSYRSLVDVKFAIPSVDILYRDLFADTNDITIEAVKKSDANPLTFKDQLKFESVSYAYPNSKQAVIKNISFTIPAFAKVGFIGKTGVGKTTLIHLMLGLLSPTTGSIKVDNVVLSWDNIQVWYDKIGYVSQSIYLIDDTIASNIAFGLEKINIDYEWLKTVAKMAELDDFIMHELPNQYETHIGERGVRLSGGQRQRIGIARALYRCPELLVLDEATSALDNITEKKVLNNINQIASSMTMVMIAHRLSTLSDCDIVFELSASGIVEQFTSSTRANSYCH